MSGAPSASTPEFTELGDGLVMVAQDGVTRGFITRVQAKDGERFEARLRHLNPGQGPSLGEFWAIERAAEAILAEPVRTFGRDPFRDLTNYATRDEMRERTERLRQRRRFSSHR
ncbi:hypothetical protein [Humidisolicoccus flavus]|uniref:hypothetical protein n=1 Tax=Humidisolicoccus flavus TaxID=3111414 RepID=UPI003243F62C